MKTAKRKIVWVSSLILDIHLHRTTQLEILKSFGKKGYDALLIGMRSCKLFRLQDNSADNSIGCPRLLVIPVRYFPVLASVIYASVLTFLLPLIIIRNDPGFVIVEPGISVIGSIPGLVVSKIKKTKVVLDIRSVPVEVEGFRGLLKESGFRVSVFIAKRFFSGITTITLMMKKEICEEIFIKPNRVGVWTSGVSPALFDPNASLTHGIELKKKLGLSGKFVVFYHGVLSSTRGITETIEATKIIAKKYSEVVLFLLGSGPFASHLKSSIKQENIQNNVIIHDAVDYEQVPKFISMCDVCIIPLPDYPYWRSQSPLKLFEYLSMEKTVIATDLPAHRSVLGNQECGIYLSSTNPEVIAQAIEFALINKDKLRDWGKVGRTIVLRNYTWKKVAEDLEHYLFCIDSRCSRGEQEQF